MAPPDPGLMALASLRRWFRGATDQLGGTASTTVLGPLVEIPSDVSQEDLTNALAAQMHHDAPCTDAVLVLRMEHRLKIDEASPSWG